jgi:hypothetical protein
MPREPVAGSGDAACDAVASANASESEIARARAARMCEEPKKNMARTLSHVRAMLLGSLRVLCDLADRGSAG